MEEYKDIANSPKYEVSNLGNIRHKEHRRVLKPRQCPKANGYVCYQVNIADAEGHQRNQTIARVVATAFIPNTENKSEVDHIDRNPANNVVSNLRWATKSENMTNTGIRSDNTSGHRNIWFNKTHQRWQITYERQKKVYHGGVFKTLEEAIAYKESLGL